jgi:Protein of unknown function (DUF2974).
MENIITYAQTNMQPMTANKFNAVDSLILSKLCYLHFERIVPALSGKPPVRLAALLRAELFESIFANQFEAEDFRRFLFSLAASPRYRNIGLNYYVDHYDPKQEKQFSAVTFLLEDKTAYVAYRGTDSTFIGWKEDFNMAYMSPIPSQQAGVEYLNAIAKRIPKRFALRVGGHSKGGNLAVYSAVMCSPNVQKRIIGVYNHDGPGFKSSISENAEYLRIKDCIYTTLPESSLIGMLLQRHEHYSVVKSNKRGIMQHEPFTWIVSDNDFVYADHIKSGAMHRNKTLNEWLNQMTDENRKRIVDVLFQVIDKTNAGTLQEFSEDWLGSVGAMLGAMKSLDPESRKLLLQTFNELAKLSFRNMVQPVS